MSFSRVLVSDPGKHLLEKVWLDVVTVILIITTIVLMFLKEPAVSWPVACALLWCWPGKWLCWLENQLVSCLFLCRVLNWQVLLAKPSHRAGWRLWGVGRERGLWWPPEACVLLQPPSGLYRLSSTSSTIVVAVPHALCSASIFSWRSHSACCDYTSVIHGYVMAPVPPLPRLSHPRLCDTFSQHFQSGSLSTAEGKPARATSEDAHRYWRG